MDETFNVSIAGPDTPTPTVTPSPTGEGTHSPTVTPTATARVCTGNCNGDGSVTVNELIALVSIALEALPPSACPPGVAPGEAVDITLLIRAVHNALNGCG